jgi:hypothetical protein
MPRCCVVLPVLVTSAVCIGCSADTATEERRPIPARTDLPLAAPRETSAPPNEPDRGIYRELESAIAQDAELRKREITFRVANGDITVTGTVQTEEERRRINDLAMNIDGVKSVANALHVED